MAKEVDEVERLQCLLVVVVVRQLPDRQVCNGQWLVLLHSGVFRMCERRGPRGLGDGSPPVGSRGKAPVGGHAFLLLNAYILIF